ncbi:hypothetical protein SAMN04487905_109160 [Actinopolyspora xinjiangensis]|uniref:Uncharacterized protein n=1 Tax=Actinopolyspora xinjiangensis TaxID=405564 RepID=A0A1H0VQA1_9ACTN|nr:hypothetical protein [Actinopolyspora xinjiangensis]SDP80762.1 hypothetical protein SAMN04487905_109160 [Actinopolyspora xinjiangensis]
MSTPTTLESSSTEPDPDFDLDVTVVAAANRAAGPATAATGGETGGDPARARGA